MSIKVNHVSLNLLNTKTRMPFRFGIACMTEAPHLFICAELSVDGIPVKGISAEGLLPKWFTKDPESTYKEEIDDLIKVVKKACDFAINCGEKESVFELWRQIYAKQKEWGDESNIPGLLWGFGVSTIERAIIDGFCKAKKTTLKNALKENRLKIRLGEVYPELDGLDLDSLLGLEGIEKIFARHTVGLTDPLRTGEILPEERVSDGLPQALEECVKEYGLKRFKIKLSGDIDRDIARLISISEILQEQQIEDYAYTLDGNENFENAEDFVSLWKGLTQQRTLNEFLSRLIFVEQPIKRNFALKEQTKKVFHNWEDRPPMIIDESDSEIGSVVQALDCGYNGTSHKNCKGIIKGIANACLLSHRSKKDPGGRYLLSGEDLVNIGPVALLQDLTVSSLLGITHIERNGHHYFKGLSMFPPDINDRILSAHSDLYKRHQEDFATLNITEGQINVKSLLDAPFGIGFELDSARFTPVDEWRYESM